MVTTTLDTPVDPDTDPAEAARVAAIEEGLRADGVPTETQVSYDYFNPPAITSKVPLTKDGGRSYVVIEKLNEGKRIAYENGTNKGVRVSRATQDMTLALAPGTNRRLLIELSVVGWNLESKGTPVPFGDSNLERFLNVMDPDDADVVFKEIQKLNPFLQGGERAVEEIDKEIAELKELRERRLAEEAGNAGS